MVKIKLETDVQVQKATVCALPLPPHRGVQFSFVTSILTQQSLRSAHTRVHVAGTCRREEFHALFTRRANMLRG